MSPECTAWTERFVQRGRGNSEALLARESQLHCLVCLAPCPALLSLRGEMSAVSGTAGLYMSKMTPRHHLICLIICASPQNRASEGVHSAAGDRHGQAGNLFKQTLPPRRFFPVPNLLLSLPGFMKRYQWHEVQSSSVSTPAGAAAALRA